MKYHIAYNYASGLDGLLLTGNGYRGYDWSEVLIYIEQVVKYGDVIITIIEA